MGSAPAALRRIGEVAPIGCRGVHGAVRGHRAGRQLSGVHATVGNDLVHVKAGEELTFDAVARRVPKLRSRRTNYRESRPCSPSLRLEGETLFAGRCISSSSRPSVNSPTTT